MNTVLLSGTLVTRRDEQGKVPRTVLEICNPETGDMFRAVAVGHQTTDGLGSEICQGAMVEITGCLTIVRWHLPGTGKTIREIGIEVQGVRLAEPEPPVARTFIPATPAQVAELRHLTQQLGLDEAALRHYLHGREPESVPQHEATQALRQLADEVQSLEAPLHRAGQLDRMMTAVGDSLADGNGRNER